MTKTIDQLKTELDAAKVAVKTNPCPETREAYKNAWNALSHATPYPHKGKGGSRWSNRAGRLQAAIRRAETQERQADAARRAMYRLAEQNRS